MARSPQQSRPPVNFSDILAAQGYGDIQTLSALVNAWIALLRAIKPQVVVADHAPTALLSAHVLSLPTVPIGAPFTIPAQLDPLPSIRPWESISQAALLQADRRVLATINEVLGNHRRPLLERVADLFAGSIPQLIGSEPFIAEIEQRIGERILHRSRGRPRKSGEKPIC